MQLLYIWVEDFRYFKNNEFNFSSKYKFKYDVETNTMEVRVCEYDTLSLLNDGKDVISDVTVIVGENGAGKTSLADLLFSDIDLSMKENRRIYILGDKKRIYFYCSGKWENTKVISLDFGDVSDNRKNKIKSILNIKNYTVPVERLNYQKEILINKYSALDLWSNKNITALYDSNTFSYQSVLRKGNDMNGIDISIGNRYLLNKEKYFNEEFKNQIDFLIGQREVFEKNIDFTLPNMVSIEIYTDKLEFLGKDNIISDFLNKLIEAIKIKNTCFQNVLVFTLNLSITNNLLGYNFNLRKENNIITKKRELKLIKEKYITYFNERINWWNYRKIGVLNFKHSIDKPIEFFDNVNKSFFDKECEIDFREVNVEELTELYNELIEENEVLGVYQSIEVSSRKMEKFYSFYKIISKYKGIEKYIGFNWVMSTGETAFLNLFSKYYSIKDEIERSNNKNLLIFIDEAELYLHPRWQQKYMSLITKYFNMLFEGKKVQLIITTHSPIMLSDIPKNHVIFLSKDKESGRIITSDHDEHKETFGGNIFDLYNDSFFLSKSESGDAMGELANEAITNAIEKLNNMKAAIDNKYNEEENINFDKELKYCNTVINTLGDPIYKTALKSQYDYIVEKRNKDLSNYNKQEVINKAISNLKNLGLNTEDIINEILKREKDD